jgi:hypothetical protein
MTSSSIRPIFHRNRASARRTRLLAASALISSFVGGVAAMLVQPALAQTLPGIPGAGSITVSTGGSMPTITAPNGNTLDIDLNAPRTVINWASLHVSGADRMDFHFDANSDIVLNKTTSQILIDAGGTVTGKVGASDGGNIWFYSPQGMIVSPGAVMTGGGFLFSRGSGISDATFVDAGDPLTNLRAATDALIQIGTITAATDVSIDASGDVVLSAATGDINASIVAGKTVEVTAISGSLNVTEVTATTGAAQVTAGGDAIVDAISAVANAHVYSDVNTIVGSATTTGASGDVVVQSTGLASLSVASSARDVFLIAPIVLLDGVDAVRDVFVTTTTGGATVSANIIAGDDIEVTATTGSIAAGSAIFRSTGLGASDDGHVLLRSTGGAVTVNAAETLGTGVAAGDIIVSAATTASLTALSLSSTSSGDLTVSGASASLKNGSAAGDILVRATTGDATVVTQAIAGDDVEVASNSGNVLAGGALLRSTGVGATDSANVLARSLSGSVTVGTAQSQGAGAAVGNVNILAGMAATLGTGNSTAFLTVSGASASLTTGVAALDLKVTATTGDATVVTSATAVDDVEITTTDGDVLAGGATLRSTGIGVTNDANVLARSVNGSVTVGTAQTQGTGAALGSVNILAATTATLGSGDANAILNVSGASATLTTGVAGRDLHVTATTGDATVVTSATAADDVEITTTDGDVLAGGATLTSTGLSTGVSDGHVWLTSTNGAVDFGTAITQGTGISAGNVTVLAGDTAVGTSAQATRDVSVTAPFGISLGAATAERDITLFATVGDVALGGAELTGSGAGHDLSITGDGAVTFGAVDASSITAANTFSRTGGNTGTAMVRSLTGDLAVYLDTSAAIDTLAGAGVEVTISSGPASFGTITANTNNIDVEALDGALTVGSATAASGDVGLYNGGGDLTITGSVHGAGLVDIDGDGLLHLTSTGSVTSDDEVLLGGDTVTIAGSVHGDGPVQIGANGLVDGTAATLISSGDDLTIFAGSVDVGVLQADGQIGVAAAVGNAEVQSAHAGVLVQVVAFTGDIFVDTAQGDDLGFAAQAIAGDVLVNNAKANGANGVVVVQAGGDATLRGAEATLGIMVEATDAGKATFGADDAASIDNTLHYAATAANSGVGCACGPLPDGLQVYSEFGDAVVNAYSVGNPIALVRAGENNNATVVLRTGDLKIDALSGENISVKVDDGTLETGLITSFGGDYTITAHDFLGDALTPTLVTGLIRDVTIIDTLGDLNLGTAAIHADRRLIIVAQDGAVTGAGQLDAGSGTTFGDVEVTADAIDLDTVRANRTVYLNAGTGLVNAATSVSVGENYALIGGDFSAAALAPLGAKAGTWNILDQVGDFDFSGKTLHYGSSIAVNVFNGEVIGGDITSDVGAVFIQADGGSLGALYAGGGQVTANGDVGGMAVGSAQGVGRITVTAVNGTASLGSAILTGPGIHGLTVRSTNGDAVLGAATTGAITAGNIVTSTGSSLALAVTAPTGKVDINLDHTTDAKLTTVSAANDVKIKVVNGPQAIGAVTSTNGAVTINGPTGALTVDQLTAHSTSRINAIGDLRLVAADADAQLTLLSLVGALRLGDGAPGRLIDVAGGLTLQAFTDIVQEQGALKANTLGVVARSGATLLGDNQIPNLLAVTVSAGDFAYHGTSAFILQDVVNVQHGTVDLRSDATIVQNLGGLILAQKLTGSSVGGARFGAANEIVELGDFTNTGGLFKLVDNRALTIGGAVLSTGTLSIASHGGMTIAGTGTVRANGAGDAVVLASDGVFTNARGADAVTAASGGGRWLIYTQAFGDPQGSTAGNMFNGLVGKSFYGSAYDFSTSSFAVGVNSGNRFVYAYQPVLTVTPNSQTLIYNGTVPATSATIAGLVNDDLAADAWSGAPAISGATSKAAGTYVLMAGVGGLASDLNYAFSYGTGSLRIDPKALTGVLTADSKIYDGTTAAGGSMGLTGVVAGDVVAASGVYAFADKNAGTGKTVTVSEEVLSGADAGNYTLDSTASGSADILKRSLTGVLTADDKTYDGTVAATGSIGLTGVVAGDTVLASGSYAFADGNAGAGKAVTASGSVLAGPDEGNYSLTSVSSALADILRRQVTVAADGGFKPFGQVEPTLTYRITIGDLVAGDAFTGALGRQTGEAPGSYGITRGTLALSANYDLTFTGAVFTIQPFSSNEAGGALTLKYLNKRPDFTLDWDPALNLTTAGSACLGEGCPPQAAVSGSKVVAALH